MMSGFQNGDYIYAHNGQTVHLRLTLGALAEICSRLHVEDISELSTRIRSADKEIMIIVFNALSRFYKLEDIDFSDLNLQMAMPALAQILETAFAPLTREASS